jgi:hypothetical protein
LSDLAENRSVEGKTFDIAHRRAARTRIQAEKAVNDPDDRISASWPKINNPPSRKSPVEKSSFRIGDESLGLIVDVAAVNSCQR